MGNIDLSKYQRKTKDGKSAESKTYVSYKSGTKGYTLVRKLRSQNINVEGLVADLLEKEVGR